MPTLRFGTCSWSEKSWCGPCYLEGTKPADFLAAYARHFDMVEADTCGVALLDLSNCKSAEERGRVVNAGAYLGSDTAEPYINEIFNEPNRHRGVGIHRP
jgi:hypothetical protein